MNIKENKTSYYVNQDEWEKLIEEEVIEDAIADASLEVMNGIYNQFQLADLINRQELMQNAVKLLLLTYTYSPKELARMVVEKSTQLPNKAKELGRVFRPND